MNEQIGSVELASLQGLLDHRFGECWPPPAHDRALLVEALPLHLVERWSICPGDSAWGVGHEPRQCPEYDNHGPCHWSGCRIRLYAQGAADFSPVAIIYRPHTPDPSYGPWLVDDGLHRISARLYRGECAVRAIVTADSAADLAEAARLLASDCKAAT
jgi:hypothetical protein